MFKKTYNKISTNSCKKANILQQQFVDAYDLNSYSDYFYNQNTNVFEFSSDTGTIYFEFCTVGGFCQESKSWMWAWGNSAIPVYNSIGLHKIKKLGEKYKFAELTELKQITKVDVGWNYTSIVAIELDAIGMYKKSDGDYTSYFVFLGQLDEQEVKIRKENVIKCDVHGGGIVSFICSHIWNNDFSEINESYHIITKEMELTDEPQAWCEKCEVERLKEGEWNDNSMQRVDLKVTCHECYFSIRDRNLDKLKNT